MNQPPDCLVNKHQTDYRVKDKNFVKFSWNFTYFFLKSPDFEANFDHVVKVLKVDETIF